VAGHAPAQFHRDYSPLIAGGAWHRKAGVRAAREPRTGQATAMRRQSNRLRAARAKRMRIVGVGVIAAPYQRS
jgi:hypothetical protein